MFLKSIEDTMKMIEEGYKKKKKKEIGRICYDELSKIIFIRNDKNEQQKKKEKIKNKDQVKDKVKDQLQKDTDKDIEKQKEKEKDGFDDKEQQSTQQQLKQQLPVILVKWKLNQNRNKVMNLQQKNQNNHKNLKYNSLQINIEKTNQNETINNEEKITTKKNINKVQNNENQNQKVKQQNNKEENYEQQQKQKIIMKIQQEENNDFQQNDEQQNSQKDNVNIIEQENKQQQKQIFEKEDDVQQQNNKNNISDQQQKQDQEYQQQEQQVEQEQEQVQEQEHQQICQWEEEQKNKERDDYKDELQIDNISEIFNEKKKRSKIIDNNNTTNINNHNNIPQSLIQSSSFPIGLMTADQTTVVLETKQNEINNKTRNINKDIYEDSENCEELNEQKDIFMDNEEEQDLVQQDILQQNIQMRVGMLTVCLNYDDVRRYCGYQYNTNCKYNNNNNNDQIREQQQQQQINDEKVKIQGVNKQDYIKKEDKLNDQIKKHIHYSPLYHHITQQFPFSQYIWQKIDEIVRICIPYSQQHIYSIHLQQYHTSFHSNSGYFQFYNFNQLRNFIAFKLHIVLYSLSFVLRQIITQDFYLYPSSSSSSSQHSSSSSSSTLYQQQSPYFLSPSDLSSSFTSFSSHSSPLSTPQKQSLSQQRNQIYPSNSHNQSQLSNTQQKSIISSPYSTQSLKRLHKLTSPSFHSSSSSYSQFPSHSDQQQIVTSFLLPSLPEYYIDKNTKRKQSYQQQNTSSLDQHQYNNQINIQNNNKHCKLIKYNPSSGLPFFTPIIKQIRRIIFNFIHYIIQYIQNKRNEMEMRNKKIKKENTINNQNQNQSSSSSQESSHSQTEYSDTYSVSSLETLLESLIFPLFSQQFKNLLQFSICDSQISRLILCFTSWVKGKKNFGVDEANVFLDDEDDIDQFEQEKNKQEQNQYEEINEQHKMIESLQNIGEDNERDNIDQEEKEENNQQEYNNTNNQQIIKQSNLSRFERVLFNFHSLASLQQPNEILIKVSECIYLLANILKVKEIREKQQKQIEKDTEKEQKRQMEINNEQKNQFNENMNENQQINSPSYFQQSPQTQSLQSQQPQSSPVQSTLNQNSPFKTSPFISADDLIPLLLFSFLRSNPPQILSTLSYISTFSYVINQKELSGEKLNNSFSHLIGCVQFIVNIHKMLIDFNYGDEEKQGKGQSEYNTQTNQIEGNESNERRIEELRRNINRKDQNNSFLEFIRYKLREKEFDIEKETDRIIDLNILKIINGETLEDKIEGNGQEIDQLDEQIKNKEEEQTNENKDNEDNDLEKQNQKDQQIQEKEINVNETKEIEIQSDKQNDKVNKQLNKEQINKKIGDNHHNLDDMISIQPSQSNSSSSPYQQDSNSFPFPYNTYTSPSLPSQSKQSNISYTYIKKNTPISLSQLNQTQSSLHPPLSSSVNRSLNSMQNTSIYSTSSSSPEIQLIDWNEQLKETPLLQRMLRYSQITNREDELKMNKIKGKQQLDDENQSQQDIQQERQLDNEKLFEIEIKLNFDDKKKIKNKQENKKEKFIQQDEEEEEEEEKKNEKQKEHLKEKGKDNLTENELPKENITHTEFLSFFQRMRQQAQSLITELPKKANRKQSQQEIKGQIQEDNNNDQNNNIKEQVQAQLQTSNIEYNKSSNDLITSHSQEQASSGPFSIQQSIHKN